MEARNSNKQKQEIGNEFDGSLHPLADNHHAIGNLRSLREGSHYTLKIESFSLLRNTMIDNHESRAFEAGGYKWKLSLYPNGNKKRNVNDHISFYLAIAETESLPLGWEVNVDFKFYVFDHIRDRYSTIQGGIRRFHRMKTEWGFDKFIPLETFNHASNGYMLEDCCVFGAEVFVMKDNGKGECVMTMKNPLNDTYTWKIDNVSKLDEEVVLSEAFVVGEHKWKLVIYPKGNGSYSGIVENKNVSVFLMLADWETLPPGWKVYAEYELCIRDESPIHVTTMQEQALRHWFWASGKGYGYPEYMALSDLNKASKGFPVHGTMIVEAEITLISYTKDF